MIDSGTKFCGAIACFAQFVDSASMATGIKPQEVFSAQAAWLWWIMGIGWLWMTSRFLWSLWTCK